MHYSITFWMQKRALQDKPDELMRATGSINRHADVKGRR